MSYQFLQKPGYVHVCLSGKLIGSDLLQLVGQLEKINAAADVAPHRLIDVSALGDVQIKADALYDLATQRRTVKLKNNVRLAIVAATDLQFGLARMYQNLNGQRQVETVVFRDFAAAQAWILGREESDAPSFDRGATVVAPADRLRSRSKAA